MRLRIAVGIVVILLPLAASADVPATKRVLLLHQAGGPGTFRGRFDLAFVEAIRSGDPASIDLYDESVETSRFPGAEQARLLREYLKHKYADRAIDVIVAQGVDAFTFARENRALFGNPPIVTIVAPSGHLNLKDNVTGLQGGFWINGTFNLALALRPATEWVYVVDGARENSNHIQVEVERQLKDHHPRLGLVYLRDLPLSEVVSRIAAIPERSVVFFVKQTMRTWSQDVDQQEALAQVVRASRVPVFSQIEQLMGHGVLGGSVWKYETDARRLATMAKRIANGAPVLDVPIEAATYETVADWNQLQRWQIARGSVPTGTKILHLTQTFFEQYRLYVLAGIALLLAQAVLIATLWIQRARRRESEARNMAILRAAPDVMFLQDRDGVYLDYHAPERGCLFVPPEQFIGYRMRDILPPNVLQHVNPLFERVLQTDQTVIGEYELEVFGGGRRRFEARLVRCGEDKVLSVVRDITERASAQAALKASEQRYALATSAGGSGVWDWNLDTNELFVDPRLKTLLGFTEEDAPDRIEEWRRRIHPDDFEMVLSRARSHISGEAPSFETEFRMPHKDGSISWFMARGSIVREDGSAPRLVGTYTDVTDRKQADAALRRAEADLDRMSRLAAFGEFTASIAHEVSQPLTAIIINTRACLRWIADRADLMDVRATLSEIIEAGKRADGIIRRNRELFRRHIVKKERVDLNDVVHEVALLSTERLKVHHVRLETRLAKGLAPVLGDRVELCQVLLNLISNSVDAMATVDAKSRVVTIATKASPQGQVQISVRDAGVGLEAVDLDRMFTTGYTTKSAGTGVGLSVCRTIIGAHRGRIWATRNDGPGATFHFTIPASSSLVDGEHQPQHEIAAITSGDLAPDTVVREARPQ
ncbi:MAG TPA: ATP-binding protein [Vicinamibacterales bacterium]|nr:ATP-binding protein [Vicinamibacterales bacterium]